MCFVTLSLFATLLIHAGHAESPGRAQTPAERSIARATQAVERAPEDPKAYAELAMAFAGRARETADPAFYDEADRAIARGAEIAPDDFRIRRARAWTLLGRHEFSLALEEIESLSRKAPDDPIVQAMLVDANVELGRYAEAEEAAQWMLDTRPGSVAALTRAAYMRELLGDVEGALELMLGAHGRIPPHETGEVAWTLTQIGKLQLAWGRVDLAEESFDEALGLMPSNPYALAGLAAVRRAQEDPRGAVKLLRERYETSPHPECLHDLAVALEAAGQHAEAADAFAEFERGALGESKARDNANRELALYYADRANRPVEALRIAALEASHRRDVRTLETLAWALHVNGRHAEAREQIERALAIGLRDAGLLYRAGAIAAAIGDHENAERRIVESLELDTTSEFTDASIALLAELEEATGR